MTAEGGCFHTGAQIVDVSCCSLLRTRDQSPSLRCGWEIDDHPISKVTVPLSYNCLPVSDSVFSW
jgi:hypothetical protein